MGVLRRKSTCLVLLHAHCKMAVQLLLPIGFAGAPLTQPFQRRFHANLSSFWMPFAAENQLLSAFPSRIRPAAVSA